jgi:hypothetical protein
LTLIWNDFKKYIPENGDQITKQAMMQSTHSDAEIPMRCFFFTMNVGSQKERQTGLHVRPWNQDKPSQRRITKGHNF